MHDDNFLSPSFFLAYLKLECLLAMGFTIFTFKAHRRNRNSVSKLLWPNRQKVFTFRVYNTTKKYSHCYSYHQLKLYTISPHPLLFNLGLLQFGVKWQIIFFLLVCLMTILWLQSHGFQRCVPSLCQSSDFCQLPFRNSSFFPNNAGLFILLHFCGRKKGDGATTVCLFSLYPCERAHNYWGPCCQHLFSLWSPSSWIRKMKSGKFLVIAWKNFETFCTKAALNILAREKTKMTTTPFENNNSIKSQQLFITEVFLCGSSSETSIVLCKGCTWTIGIISPPSSKIIIKYHGARNDTRASLHIAILISTTPSSPQHQFPTECI